MLNKHAKIKYLCSNCRSYEEISQPVPSLCPICGVANGEWINQETKKDESSKNNFSQPKQSRISKPNSKFRCNICFTNSEKSESVPDLCLSCGTSNGKWLNETTGKLESAVKPKLKNISKKTHLKTPKKRPTPKTSTTPFIKPTLSKIKLYKKKITNFLIVFIIILQVILLLGYGIFLPFLLLDLLISYGFRIFFGIFVFLIEIVNYISTG